MKENKWVVIIVVAIVLLCLACLALIPVAFIGYQLFGLGIDTGPLQDLVSGTPETSTTTVPFERAEIDNMAGDIKLVGDIDGDGFPDLVLGGMQPHEPLSWYRYPDWQKSVIAVAGYEFTTDGAIGDIDGDGDLDIAVPDGNSGENLLWFENPGLDGDPAEGSQWSRHTIGSIDGWGKDVALADYDGDGSTDVATRVAQAVMIFFQTGSDTWQKSSLENVQLGLEGMASGDVDSDGYEDLVLRGVWLQNPGGDLARSAAEWTQYEVGPADENFKALVVDLDQDGQNDILFSSSEGRADVNWWSPVEGDPTGSWNGQTIVKSLDRAHTLQAADMDLDGDTDVVLGQMHTSPGQEIMILFNLGGDGVNWQKQLVDVGGLHNGVVADIGNDGDFDIYGANWTGNPPARLWENQLDSAGPVDRFSYHQVSAEHEQTFGLAFGDVDSDGQKDIVSGRFWYSNPGGDLMGVWTQHKLPEGMQASLVLNVDGDELTDIIAQKDEGDIALYWLEPTDPTAANWNQVNIGAVDRASHALGAQGYRVADVEDGGPDEVIFSSGAGIYYFRVPVDPSAGNWPRVHMNPNPSDEGFALGDVDGDGDLDIAGTTGDSKRVEWYQNPGDGSDGWQALHIGSFEEALFPDRTEVADLNQDGRLDIIVTEENGTDSDAETYWWEQPTDPTSGNWRRHLIVSQATTNSLDVADIDQDGDTDVILAEHRGPLRLAIWLNDGDGVLVERVIAAGQESHLGARSVDLDDDGDLDVVSIAWDDFKRLHLWRNDAFSNSQP